MDMIPEKKYLSLHDVENIEIDLKPNFFKHKTSVDRFGFTSMILEKLNLKFRYRTFCEWAHGWIWWDDEFLPIDVLGPRSYHKDLAIVVASKKQQAILINEGYSNVILGGLPIVYTEDFPVTRKKNTLLASIAHSAESDIQHVLDHNYLDYLESIRKDWEDIYVSVFGLDWSDNMDNAIKSRGLKLLYGAHPFDKSSLNRTKYNFLTVDSVSSNMMGSHIAYAVSCGCKTSLFSELAEYDPNVLPSSSLGYTLQDAERLSRFYQYEYLIERFPYLFKNPENGYTDTDLGSLWIGKSFKLNNIELMEALGWNAHGQLTGYTKGFYRRVKRIMDNR